MSTGSDERKYGFILIDNEVVDDYKLGPQAGWLYVVILRYVNQKTNVAFPSLSTLAEKAGMSEPTVIKYLDVLKTSKLIAVDPQIDPETGANKSNHYRALPVKKKGKKRGGVVKEFNQGGKAALPGVVKEFNTNNTESEQDDLTKQKKELANTPTAVGGGEVVTDPEIVPAPSKKKRAAKVKTLADLDPLRSAIAHIAFEIMPGQGITARSMIRVNLANAELRDRFESEGQPVTAPELIAAFTWHSALPGHPARPKDGPKMGDMVAGYRKAIRPPTPTKGPTSPLADAWKDADRDCLACGGNGVIRRVTGENDLCRCVQKNREVRHVVA